MYTLVEVKRVQKRLLEMALIIRDILESNEIPYFICAGTLANNDRFGKMVTCYSTEYYEGAMDNIAVKGGRIINAAVLNTNDFGGSVLSDHYLIYCDVVFE